MTTEVQKKCRGEWVGWETRREDGVQKSSLCV